MKLPILIANNAPEGAGHLPQLSLADPGYDALKTGADELGRAVGRVAQLYQKRQEIEAGSQAAQMLTDAETAITARELELKQNPDPDTHAENIGYVIDDVRGSVTEGVTNRDALRLFQQHFEPVRRRKLIEGQTDAFKMFLDNEKAQLAEGLDTAVKTIGTLTPTVRENGELDTTRFDATRQQVVDQLDLKTEQGVISQTERAKLQIDFDTRAFHEQAKAFIASSPGTWLMWTFSGKNPFAGKIDGTKMVELNDYAARVAEHRDGVMQRQFARDSGERVKDLEVRAREADITNDVVAAKAYLTKEDFQHALTYNDAQRKVRNAGESNAAVVAAMKIAIDAQGLRNPSQITALMNTGIVNSADGAELVDRIRMRKTEEQAKADSLLDKQVTEARDAGRRYIDKLLTINPPGILAKIEDYKAVENLVKAGALDEFERRVNGVRDIAQIRQVYDEIAQRFIPVLAKDIDVKAKDIEPMLRQFRTPDEVKAGLQNGLFGDPRSADARAKAASMMEHLRLIETLLNAKNPQRLPK